MLLLDTNVISELRKLRAGKADPAVTSWATAVSPSHCFLSVVTLQELEIGILLMERKDPRQGTLLRTWLEQHILLEFADRVLDVDAAVVRSSAQMHVPNPCPLRDSLIAATAKVHGLTLVTRNIGNFLECGVALLNPWRD